MNISAPRARSKRKPTRPSDPVTFWLPESFNPREFLPEMSLRNRLEDCCYLMSQILTKTALNCTDDDDFAHLDSEILRYVMDNRCVAEIIARLVDGEAIKTSPYMIGVMTTGYKLGERWNGNKPVCVPATNKRLIGRVLAERERMREEARGQWRQIHYDLDREQQHVTVTAEIDWLLDKLPVESQLCQRLLVEKLKRQERTFAVGATGRCYNCFSNLQRLLRQAVRIDGHTIGGLDIKNSQPALLAMLIDRHRLSPLVSEFEMHNIRAFPDGCPSLPLSRPLSLGPDVSRFIEYASSGVLYEILCDESGLDRSTVKIGVLKHMLAKKRDYPNPVDECFSDMFPSVRAIVRNVNRHDHGEMIRFLQRVESWLMIDNVCPRLLSTGTHFVTLHDGIYAPEQDLDTVKAVCTETFESLGIRLSLSREIPNA